MKILSMLLLARIIVNWRVKFSQKSNFKNVVCENVIFEMTKVNTHLYIEYNMHYILYASSKREIVVSQ